MPSITKKNESKAHCQHWVILAARQRCVRPQLASHHPPNAITTVERFECSIQRCAGQLRIGANCALGPGELVRLPPPGPSPVDQRIERAPVNRIPILRPSLSQAKLTAAPKLLTFGLGIRTGFV